MLRKAIAEIVKACVFFHWYVIAVCAVLAVGSSFYLAEKFAINTDINTLISPKLEWRKREIGLEKSFPQRLELILAVVDAPTPELARLAQISLADRLETDKTLFRNVTRPDGDFFEQNGLLFLPTDELKQATEKLRVGAPVIRTLATDPSLRGLTYALNLGLLGVQGGQITLDGMAPLLNKVSDAVQSAFDGKQAYFSFQELLSGKAATPSELRKFIEIQPVLDYAALEPGKKPSDAIRQAAADLKLAENFGARVRLTGPVPIADEEFATVQENQFLNIGLTVLCVLLILWGALHSVRIIAAVFITITIGLAITAAAGIMMVGAINLISIAFAVLFIGLGVDFGIQFAVRYRSERFKIPDLQMALMSAARRVGAPLTLAAAATACGFLSFLPTDYKGVSELGLIAGVGMLIAYVLSVTLLPALLTIFNPPGEEDALGWSVLAPVDTFLERHRIAVVALTLGTALAGLPLLYYLQFDFNPFNLRSPKVESMATYLDLQHDPENTSNAINLLVADQPAARAAAERLAKVPEVMRVTTLESFVPPDQTAKLAMIRPLERSLGPALRQEGAPKPPTDAENVAALNRIADGLTNQAAAAPGPGATAANRAAATLTKLANAAPDMRTRVEPIFLSPLKSALSQLQASLQAKDITLRSLPASFVELWTLKDGRTRIEALPKGDQTDNEVLRNFASAVQAVEPNAIGGPVSILESGKTIVHAFIQAGVWALLSIALLLWIVLRKFTDVLLTLVPLLLAGVLTLEICVLIGMPLNFANIIALPLLLGVGVAFKIYYIMAWRAGRSGLLQSSLTRAVVFSALTTATAFGSLWLSSHPGTSSMGKLMALSLVTTMLAAVFFQPALMGKPRSRAEAAAAGPGMLDDEDA